MEKKRAAPNEDVPSDVVLQGTERGVVPQAVASLAGQGGNEEAPLYDDRRPHQIIKMDAYNMAVRCWPDNYFVQVVGTYDVPVAVKNHFILTGDLKKELVPAVDPWKGNRDEILNRQAEIAFAKARDLSAFWKRTQCEGHLVQKDPSGEYPWSNVKYSTGKLPSEEAVYARDALDFMQLWQERQWQWKGNRHTIQHDFETLWKGKFSLMECVFELYQTWTKVMRGFMSITTPMFSIHDDMNVRLQDIRERSAVAHTTREYFQYCATKPEAFNTARWNLCPPRRDMLKLALDRTDLDRLATHYSMFCGLPTYGMDKNGFAGPLMRPSIYHYGGHFNHSIETYNRYFLVISQEGIVFDAFKLAKFFDRRIDMLSDTSKNPWVAQRMDFYELRPQDIHVWINEAIRRGRSSSLNGNQRERIRRLYITKFVQCVRGITTSFNQMMNFMDSNQDQFRYSSEVDVSVEAIGLPDSENPLFHLVPSGDEPNYDVSEEVRRSLNM